MSRRSRMSIGPGSLPALGDASSRANRSPFGSSGASDDSCSVGGGSARKDRRAMLDEWRRNRQAAGQPPAAGAASARPPSAPAPSYPSRALSPIAASPADGNGDRGGAEEHTAELTANINYGRPPASAPSSEEAGLSALERYRLRKKRQAEQQAAAAAGGAEPGGGNGHHATATPTKGRRHLTVKPPSHSSSSHGGDLEEEHTIAHGSYNLGTPSRRGKTSRASLGGLGGGAQRRVRRRTSLAPSEMQPQPPLEQQRKPGKPLLPPSYPPPHERSNERSAASAEAADEPVPAAAQGNVGGSAERDAAAVVLQQQHAAAAATAFSQESVESIDSAAMQSRMLQMQNRINKLESEKTELIMSKAPLEARMRQREDAWVKERERLLGDIDARQAASKGADERYRELEMRNEALEEENSRLRLEARASASATAGDGASGGAAGGAKDSWTERLQANSEIKDLRKELRNKDDEIKSLRIEKVSLETEVFGCKQEIESLERNYDELERDYSELETSKAQNSEAEIQLQALTTEHTAMTAQLNATCADLEEIKTRAKADLQAKEDSWRGRESELLFEMSVLKSRAGKIVQDDAVDGTGGDDDEDDPAILKARIEERDRRISELEEQLQSGEQLRRALHNRIQELRGNIRVYVRTRPFLPSDGSSTQSSIDILPDGESLQIQGKHVGETHSFKFDKVFAPSTGQDLVFDEVSEFVQSALDGYHVCLFSYGQTGSGKTHTMQGSGNAAMRGIIPRAVEQVLSQAALMQSQRWTFTIKASFLEIYNEDLRDLLVNVNADGSTKARDSRSAAKLSIKRTAEGKSYVDGINMVDIDVGDRSTGLSQLESVMAAAARSRSVATTKMNAQSSRSHSVFMLHLCGRNDESGTVVQGALNLCDLAGSERLDRSGASSDAKRLKETQAINKSLSALGDVFTSLANGSKHVPFRNSKLTYLLQDCLSGDGKALMFVNLSPTLQSSPESLCSLRFAQRVNQVELGAAKKRVTYSSR